MYRILSLTSLSKVLNPVIASIYFRPDSLIRYLFNNFSTWICGISTQIYNPFKFFSFNRNCNSNILVFRTCLQLTLINNLLPVFNLSNSFLTIELISSISNNLSSCGRDNQHYSCCKTPCSLDIHNNYNLFKLI